MEFNLLIDCGIPRSKIDSLLNSLLDLYKWKKGSRSVSGSITWMINRSHGPSINSRTWAIYRPRSPWMNEGLSLGKELCHATNMLHPTVVIVLPPRKHTVRLCRDYWHWLWTDPNSRRPETSLWPANRDGLMEVRWSVECCSGSFHSGLSGCWALHPRLFPQSEMHNWNRHT